LKVSTSSDLIEVGQEYYTTRELLEHDAEAEQQMEEELDHSLE
jgi:hypothetical protein